MIGTIVQQAFNALTIGSIYALIALGYTMVYGVLRMINFAHGEMFMLGAYAAFVLLTLMVPDIGAAGALVLTVAFFGAILLIGVVGVGIERIAYKPLRHSTRLAPMLSSLGVSLFLVTGVQIAAGPQPVRFPSFFPVERYDVMGGSITSVQIGILVASFVLMFTLNVFVNRSRLGIIVRAVSESRPTAQLLGIDVNGAISLIFFLGPLLGAAGGILYSSYYGIMTPSMGATVGMKAFTAAILGGIGSIPGAMIGAFILAFVEVAGTALLPVVTFGALGTEYRDVFAFVILILVLLFRPAGLLGEAVSEESMVYKREF
jgi:branched-chain amino acid transport system permease protein